MSLWRQLVRGVRALSNRAAVDAELEEELRDYFERARADLVQQGLTPEEAERVARRELGDLGKARDTLRSYGWEKHVDTALGDFRQSWRRLAPEPELLRRRSGDARGRHRRQRRAVLAVPADPAAAAAGRGARAARQSRRPGTGSRLYARRSGGGLTFGSIAGNRDHVFSYPMFRDLERQQGPFAGIAAHRLFDASLSIGESARRDTGFFVSGSYFSVLGLRPALGRLLGTEDDRVDGQAESVVLSYAYWQRELAGDPGVLGRKLTVNGAPLTIVGVAPQGFHGTTVGARASVFVPITFRGVGTPTSIPNHDNRGFYWVYLFARLGPGMERGDGGERDQSAIPGDLERDRSASDRPRGEAESRRGVPYEIPRARAGRARAERAASADRRAALEMLFAVSGAGAASLLRQRRRLGVDPCVVENRRDGRARVDGCEPRASRLAAARRVAAACRAGCAAEPSRRAADPARPRASAYRGCRARRSTSSSARPRQSWPSPSL